MKVLKNAYGKKLIQLYQAYKPGVDYREIVRRNPHALAIHGHYQLKDFRPSLPAAKTVAWLRHPVSRIESYYNYWSAVKPRGNQDHQTFLEEKWDIVQLSTFLRNEVTEYYLAGYDATDLDFVGIFEHVDADIQRFYVWAEKNAPTAVTAQGWRRFTSGLPFISNFRCSMPQTNRTRKKGELSADTAKKIESILTTEMEFYRKALELRAASI